MEVSMRKTSLLAMSAALVIASGAIAYAAEKEGPGKSGETPGHEMQEHGSVPGSPGASGYAPGHNKDADDLRGRGTTGAGGRDRDDMKSKDRGDMKMKRDSDDSKLKRDSDDRK
jgi:hypothetical protein